MNITVCELQAVQIYREAQEYVSLITVLNREGTERKRDSDKELLQKLERSFNHNVRIENAQELLGVFAQQYGGNK
jgi:hypothetical protein